MNEVIQLGERMTIGRLIEIRYSNPSSEFLKLPEHTRSSVARQTLQRYAETTIAGYNEDLFSFQMFCAPHKIRLFPLDGQVVAAFLTSRAGKYAYSSIERSLAALACAQRILGFPSIWRDQCVRDTLAGIRNEHGSARTPQLPIMREMLDDIVTTALKNKSRIIALRSALVPALGFEIISRGGELAVAKRSHLKRRPAGYTFYFPKSKNDRGGKGYTVAIIASPELSYNIVELLDEYLALLPPGDGPIFPRVNKHGKIKDEHVTEKRITQMVKDSLIAAGHSPNRRSAHSLRSGGISQAAKDGLSDDEICEESRHETKSAMWGYRQLDADTIIQRKITTRLGYGRPA